VRATPPFRDPSEFVAAFSVIPKMIDAMKDRARGDQYRLLVERLGVEPNHNAIVEAGLVPVRWPGDPDRVTVDRNGMRVLDVRLVARPERGSDTNWVVETEPVT
jgi:hypothetical protein